MRAVGAVFWAVWLTWLFSQPAFAEKRVALVMGNSAYQNVARLANPTNDSEAMSAIFKEAGFDVVELKRDLNVSGMRRALRDFSDNVRDADIAIVYFAGHGIEINGNNYLIPVDAVLERDIDAFDEAIPLDRILTVVEPAKQLRLVILDACRDNPFNKTIKRTIGSRAIGRGLAKVEPDNPNTLIAFAAKAGSTAMDGDSKNSPFTAALVKYLPKPGLDLRRAFGYARDDVLKATNHKQEPFIYGSLGGDDVALVPQIAKPVSEAEARIEAAGRRGSSAVVGGLAKGHDAFPIGRGVVWNGKDACRIAEIDANRGFLRKWSAGRLQQIEREGAGSRGVDDEVRRNRLARAIVVLIAHAGNRLSIWRGQQFLDPAMLAQRDVRAAFHPPSHNALDGRP
jgi:hypothetical protein